MQKIYEINAAYDISVNGQTRTVSVLVSIPADSEAEAIASVKESKLSHNRQRTYSSGSVGERYSVTSQPAGFSFLGHRFKDGELRRVCIYRDNRTVHFGCADTRDDATFGIWAYDAPGFERDVKRLKEELGLA